MAFELDNFKHPPVKREYKPHAGIKDGEGVQLELNLDLLTYERMESFEKQYNDAIEVVPDDENEEKSSTGKPEKIEIFRFVKIHMEFRAQSLGGKPGENNPDNRLIRDWDVVHKGKKVPVSYKTFISMPKKALDSLYEYVTEEAGKPTEAEKKR